MARRTTERQRKVLFIQAGRVIRNRYAEFDLSLADVAAEVEVSPRQLQRIFRETGGTEFQAVLLRVRMEAARRLLEKKNGLTVQATARAVGYRGRAGLVAASQRFYGEPPSAFQPEDEPEVAPPIEWD